jgi:hypothetical protein
MTDLLTWAAAKKAKELGMARAVDHADRKVTFWSADALAYVDEFSKLCGKEFLAEDVREYAHGHGLEDPPDGRAWGAVFTRAAKLNLIEQVGYAPAKSSRGSPKVLWRRCAT